MAKDTRKIVRGVRIDDVVYTDGQEDELAEKLDKNRIVQLTENGTLEGDWGQPDAEPKTPRKAAK